MKTRCLWTSVVLVVLAAGCGSDEGSKEGEETVGGVKVTHSETVTALVASTVQVYRDYSGDLNQLLEAEGDDSQKYLKMPAMHAELVARIEEEISPQAGQLPEDEQRAYYLAITDKDLGKMDPEMASVEREIRDMISAPPGDHAGISNYAIQALNYRAQVTEWKFDALEMYQAAL